MLAAKVIIASNSIQCNKPFQDAVRCLHILLHCLTFGDRRQLQHLTQVPTLKVVANFTFGWVILGRNVQLTELSSLRSSLRRNYLNQELNQSSLIFISYFWEKITNCYFAEIFVAGRKEKNSFVIAADEVTEESHHLATEAALKAGSC